MRVPYLSSGVKAAFFIAVLITPSSLQAQECLHNTSESVEQRERRQAAIRYLGLVNAAQTRSQREKGKYVSLNELRVESGPLGFVPRLVIDHWNYMISLKDLFDPCGFTLFSDHQGVIYEAHPIVLDETSSSGTHEQE